MGVSIRSAEAERRLRRVARLKAIEASVRRIKSLPVLSTATEDEILGCNDKGYFD